jgi:serine/threonine protein kinase
MTIPATTPGSMQIVARDSRGHEVRYQTDGEPLGEGSGGIVWLAKRLPNQDEAGAEDARRVAIKMTKATKWKGYLAEEAKLLAALQACEAELLRLTGGMYRPVRVLSGRDPLNVDDAYQSALIELEYLDGPTLKRWFEDTWRAGPTPAPEVIVDEVLRVARQLAEALVQIQEGPTVGLIHRDIKPDNLMRTSRGLRLFDFNVAREDSGSERTQHVGTHGYMAPEVAESGNYDTRADLFSVGVVLWEIALRRRFDLAVHTERRNGRLYLRWPIGAVETWPTPDQRVVGELLEALVVDRELRMRSARELLDRVDAIERARRPPDAADPFARLDMIELLAEVRPSALAAVVTDTPPGVAAGQAPDQRRQDELRRRMRVDDPLEDWLTRELTEAAQSARKGPVLYVLAGNAGDGKSHLLQQVVRRRVGAQPAGNRGGVAGGPPPGPKINVEQRFRIIADATHALRADSSQRERLAEFFAPFADTDASADDRVHLIAMNTGMVIRFFEGEDKDRFKRLYDVLSARLGLRRVGDAELDPPWRVEVVNLDLRDVLAPGPGGKSFAERMLDRLDPENPDSLAAPRWAACQSCSALSLCPVAFNLRALRMPTPRRAVLHALRRVALDNDVHTSPRSLWGFVYRLATGGVERYDVPERGDKTPCQVVRSKVDAGDGKWLLAGQFSELLFQQPDAGAPWSGLAKLDPAFCGAPAIDDLHTRISVKTELDNDPKHVEELGGTGRTLAGLALDALMAKLPDTDFKGRRRDAAIRRQAMFHAPTFEAWATHDGAEDFLPLLDAYDAYSRDGARLNAQQQEQLMGLRGLVQAVFLHGHGRVVDGQAYLRVSQPNVRAKSMLLVKADDATLRETFEVRKIVNRDVHVLAHRGREALLNLLGYRPSQVTLGIAGVRLTVDLALYEFLRRVREGQKPSKRAMSQFQALTFVGERVGNLLASNRRTTELFVWDEAKGCLYRLATDDFGHPRIDAAR